MKVSFTTDDGEVVAFDERGDPPGRYSVMGYSLLQSIDIGDEHM